MRKDGYYWAKHRYMEDTEVVQVTVNSCGHNNVWRTSLNTKYDVSDFEWIDDEPITVKKMPVQLVDGAYYVIKKTIRVTDNPFVAKYDQFCDTFLGNCQRHSKELVSIISGPFSIEQLINLESC